MSTATMNIETPEVSAAGSPSPLPDMTEAPSGNTEASPEVNHGQQAVVCLDLADGTARDPPTNATEAVTAEAIVELLRGKDLQNFSLKQVRVELEEKLGYTSGSLSDHPYKHRIKELTTLEVQRRMTPAEDLPSTPPVAKASGQSESSAAKRARSPEATGKTYGSKAQKMQSGMCPGPLTKRSFVELAKPLAITVADQSFELHQRMFSTGSCGYFGQATIPVMIDGHKVMVKLGVNATIPNSKGWEEA